MSDSSSAAQTFRRSLDALIGRHTQQQSDYNTHMLQGLRNDGNAFPTATMMSPQITSLAHLMPTGLPPIAPMSMRGQSLDQNLAMRGKSLDLTSGTRGQSLDLNTLDAPSWQHSLVAAMGGLQMANSRLGMEGLSLSESQLRAPSLATVMEPEAMMPRNAEAVSGFAPTDGLSTQQ